jgi:predicted enzyme related to lactoylglutathione lyase
MIKKIAFTMYPVRDMARARQFYERQLELPLSWDFEGRWIEYEIQGGVFAITDMLENNRPAADAGGVIAFEVDDVDALTDKLKLQGARVLTPPFSTPVCRMSIVADPDGNAVTLHKVTD